MSEMLDVNEVLCEKCGARLTVRMKDFFPKPLLYVTPCETCLKEEWSDGHADASDDAYDDAYEEGREYGYDTGYEEGLEAAEKRSEQNA